MIRTIVGTIMEFEGKNENRRTGTITLYLYDGTDIKLNINAFEGNDDYFYFNGNCISMDKPVKVIVRTDKTQSGVVIEEVIRICNLGCYACNY